MVSWYSTNINLSPVHTLNTQSYSTKSALLNSEGHSLGTYNYNTKQELDFSEAHDILFSYVSHSYAPPFLIIPLSSTGTGSGVANIRLKSSSNVTMTIDGNGMFYDNPGGTINPGNVRIITSGSLTLFFIKVTSGDCNITIDDKSKIIAWGDATFNGWDSLLNGPTINLMNVNDISNSITTIRIDGNNTIYGDVSDLPNNLTFYQISDNSIVTGELSGLPRTLTVCNLVGNNTVYGDLLGLPDKLTQLYISGSNIVSGNLSSLPSSLINLSLAGNNTVTGVLYDLPRGITFLDLHGLNTIHGDLADLPSGITFLDIDGHSHIDTYTPGRTWLNGIIMFWTQPYGAGSGIPSTGIDNVIIDMANSSWSSHSGTIWLAGNNFARTSASDAARTTLVALGRAVIPN